MGPHLDAHVPFLTGIAATWLVGSVVLGIFGPLTWTRNIDVANDLERPSAVRTARGSLSRHSDRQRHTARRVVGLVALGDRVLGPRQVARWRTGAPHRALQGSYAHTDGRRQAEAVENAPSLLVALMLVIAIAAVR